MKLIRILGIVFLCYLGVSAVVGAIPLIVHSRQQPWQMPQNLLEHSPFHSYLIPGIILLVANGLLCLYVLTVTLMRRPGYGWWIAAQGCVLLIWLVVECILIRLVVWPHYFYGAIGGILVGAGLVLRRDMSPAPLTRSIRRS